MKEEVTIEKAIKRGKFILLNFFIIWIIIMGIGLFILTLGETLIWVFLLLFFGGLPVSGFIALFLLNKWKYWAFGSVRNVHELKKRAIQTGAILIEENDTFFRKIENSTEKDRKLWNIKQKFHQKDFFVDDLSVPSETHIYHSKVLIYFFLFIAVFTIVGFVYVFIGNILIVGITALIVVAVFLHLNRDKLKREQSQIILSNRGIETILAGFSSWKDIKNEQVYIDRAGKNTKYYLIYQISERQESVLLTGLNIGDGRIAKLLILYRNRYEQQNK